MLVRPPMSGTPVDPRAQRRHDYVVAGLATVIFILLSLPYSWWANASPTQRALLSPTSEGPQAWTAYFIGGGLLSCYVVFVFIRSLRTLNTHDHSEASDE